jgi:hypothetical protein
MFAWYRAIRVVTMTPDQQVVIPHVGVVSSMEIRDGMRAARAAYAEGDRYSAVCAMERAMTAPGQPKTLTTWAWANNVLNHLELAA